MQESFSKTEKGLAGKLHEIGKDIVGINQAPLRAPEGPMQPGVRSQHNAERFSAGAADCERRGAGAGGVTLRGGVKASPSAGLPPKLNRLDVIVRESLT